MICEACGIDKVVTVTYGITITRYSPRDGRAKAEQRERRLCVRCDAGMPPDEARA